jgi:hypothetical protein
MEIAYGGLKFSFLSSSLSLLDPLPHICVSSSSSSSYYYYSSYTSVTAAAANILMYNKIHYGTLVSPAGTIWFKHLHQVLVDLMLGVILRFPKVQCILLHGL